MDIVYTTWWSGNWQVLWGWVCIPLLWIKLPGQDLSPSMTLQAITDTFSCFCGHVPHPGDESCATSPTPMFWFAVYLCFNLSFNLLLLWLTKHMSAAWATLATVLCLDLTNVFGMFPCFAGGGAQAMTLNDWLATILASIALWVYNLEPEKTRLAAPSLPAGGKAEESDNPSEATDEPCESSTPP